MIKALATKETIRYEDEVEEVGNMIGIQGDAAQRKKDQKIWFIDEEQDKRLKLHKDLQKNMPYLQGGPSREKCVILEKEVDVLWKKVRIY